MCNKARVTQNLYEIKKNNDILAKADLIIANPIGMIMRNVYFFRNLNWLCEEFYLTNQKSLSLFLLCMFHKDYKIINNIYRKLCIKFSFNLIGMQEYKNNLNEFMREVRRNIMDSMAFFNTAKQCGIMGKAIIENSKSILGYIKMPYVLSYIKEQHLKEQKQYQEKIKKNPNLKLPKLESYQDYKEALKEKECFTYQLGEALIRANTLKNNTHNPQSLSTLQSILYKPIAYFKFAKEVGELRVGLKIK